MLKVAFNRNITHKSTWRERERESRKCIAYWLSLTTWDLSIHLLEENQVNFEILINKYTNCCSLEKEF
jgi:hypothetical protein